MFVYNEVDHDRRVLKEAEALSADGWSVTIHGVRKGRHAVTDRRRRPSGVEIIRHASTGRANLPPGWHPILALIVGPAFVLCTVVASALAALGLGAGRRAQKAMELWTWSTAAACAGMNADILHAHDLTGGIPALLVARKSNARLVYDSHEVFLASVAWATAPYPVRSLLATFVERPLLRRSSALLTVNPDVEQQLGDRYALPDRHVVIYNCADPIDHGVRSRALRDAIGVGDEAQVVLYHGGFSQHRGIEQLIAAFRDPRLANAHLVFLGYGPLESMLLEAAADESAHARLHVLSAVDPDVLVEWVSGADVGVCAVLPSTLNHRISTPNKLFEALAAGVPVVGSDFPGIRRILIGDPLGPLGATCDPTDVSAVADAIASVLELPPVAREQLRSRCRAAARERWNWTMQAARLVALYREI